MKIMTNNKPTDLCFTQIRRQNKVIRTVLLAVVNCQ